MFEVYTYGGGLLLVDIFNAVAAITNTADFSTLIATTGVFALIWQALITAFGAKNNTYYWFLSYTLLYSLLIVPKTTVQIIDRVNPTLVASIDNVPYALGAFASYSSRLGDGLTVLFEQNFSLPDDMQYHQTGFLFGSKLIETVTSARIQGAEFGDNVNEFIKHCVFYDIALGTYTMDEMKDSGDLWEFLIVDNTQSDSRTFEYADNGSSTITTCNQGSASLEAKWEEEIDDAFESYGLGLFPDSDSGAVQDSLKTYFTAYLPSTYEYIIGGSKTASEVMQQNMLINAMNYAAADYSGQTMLDVYSQSRADGITKSSYQSIGRQAEKWVPMIKIIYEAIYYGAFPFVFLVFLLPMGLTVFRSYFTAFIWLQSWAPLYAILHRIMLEKNQSYTSHIAGQSSDIDITFANHASIIEIQSELAAVAGYFSILIPFIALKLMQGISSAAHMAGSMLAVPQQAAQQSAQEATSGNMSLGNVSIDNANYSNLGAHKMNDSFASDSGRVSMVSSTGSSMTMNPDGGSVVNQSGSMSSLHDDFKSEHSKSQVYAQSSSIATERAETDAISSMSRVAASNSSIVNSSEFQNQSEQNGLEFSQNLSSAEKDAYNNIHQASERFSSDQGMSKQASANVLASVSVGSGGMFGDNMFGKMGKLISGGGTGSTSLNSVSEDKVSAAQDLVEQFNLEKSFETLSNAARNDTLQFSDSEGRSLNHDIQNNLEKADSFERSSAQHLEYAETFNERAESSESGSVVLSENLNQEYLEFVSNHQRYDDPSKTYGEGGALEIVDNQRFNKVNEGLQNEFMENQLYDKGIELIGQQGNFPGNQDEVRYNHNIGVINVGDKGHEVEFAHNGQKIKTEDDYHNAENKREQIDNSDLKNHVGLNNEAVNSLIQNQNVANQDYKDDVEEILDDSIFTNLLKNNNNKVNTKLVNDDE